MKNYIQEFDKFVGEYNLSLENSEIRKRNWTAFFSGMGSVLNIFGNSIEPFSHPCGDLSPEQKEAIELASDIRRIDKNLDKIISGDLSNAEMSEDDAKLGKKLAQKIYNHFRDIYISHALSRASQ